MTNHPNRKQTQFFARTNHYGSETSIGFDNTFSALVFDSRAARDAYVEENSHRNLAIKPITKAEAVKLADRNGPDCYARAVDGRLIRIN